MQELFEPMVGLVQLERVLQVKVVEEVVEVVFC
jgi:hypothetical protein